MSRLFFRIFPLVFIFLAFAREASAQIYADVTVSGAVSGTFTINLEYTKAPAAVANFIGLATGSKGWIDQNTGSLRHDPFYNGVTFHRVIANFMSQTGSRSGDGKDGPGYTFQNEIDSSLTFATPYTVGLANSGRWYTNGAQWFVTANSNQSGLDGSYTIFGTVCSGTEVCDALNNVATTSGSDSHGAFTDRPAPPVTISSIAFRGPSLASFDLNPDALPKVLSAQPAMKVSGSTYSLGFDHNAFSYYYLYDSPDLNAWTNSLSGYFGIAAPAAGDADVTSVCTTNKHFFKFARVDYSLCYNHYYEQFIPGSLAGKSLHFNSPLNGSLVLNANQTAKYWIFDNNYSYTLSYYNYLPIMGPYQYWGTLSLQLENGVIFIFDYLVYTSATGGNFYGRTNDTEFSGTNDISGTFTSLP